MKVKIISLYNNLNNSTIEEYSKFKFGYVNVIEYLAKKMAKLILKQIPKNKKYVLYTTNKFPIKSYFKKNSLLLTEKISKRLNLPLVIGEYKYLYNKNTFYDHSHKKIHLPKINKKDKLKFKNYTFLMVDDSIWTKVTLNASLNELKNVAKNVIFFSVINLKNTRYSETEINDFCYKKYGLNYIIKLLNSDGYILTTHMLRVINTFKNQELKFLFEKINKINKKLLLKSFKEYTGKELFI